MAETFTWIPDDKPQGNFDFRIRDVRFGNGYRQIAPDGLHDRTQVWPLSFDRDDTEIGAIAQFLDDNRGEWFWWTPPGSNATIGKYVCMEGYRKMPYSGNNEKLSCTFEEFPTP